MVQHEGGSDEIVFLSTSWRGSHEWNPVSVGTTPGVLHFTSAYDEYIRHNTSFIFLFLLSFSPFLLAPVLFTQARCPSVCSCSPSQWQCVLSGWWLFVASVDGVNASWWVYTDTQRNTCTPEHHGQYIYIYIWRLIINKKSSIVLRNTKVQNITWWLNPDLLKLLQNSTWVNPSVRWPSLCRRRSTGTVGHVTAATTDQSDRGEVKFRWPPLEGTSLWLWTVKFDWLTGGNDWLGRQSRVAERHFSWQLFFF